MYMLKGLYLGCNLAEDPGWIPHHDGIGWHVFGDHTTSTNDSILTHSNAA
jgi:hypothetical protein